MSIPNFLHWFSEHGGSFHIDGSYVPVPGSGHAIRATALIPENSKIVSCPIDLVISKKSSAHALAEILELPVSSFDSWSVRQCIASYLFLHSVDQSSPALRHHAYIATLPPAKQLLTAMYFSETEREIFQGTNMYSAISDRQTQWTAEWTQCREIISQANADWGTAFDWDKFLVYATYISSRAFPSSILLPNPTNSSPNAEPVMIPGLDAFNHKRGQPVTWVYSEDPKPTINIVTRAAIQPSDEIFNNYGPRPNVELILGYGFSSPNNPDDIIVLQIGGKSTNKRWEIGRGAKGMDQLWDELVGLVAEDPSSPPTYEDFLEAAAALHDMTTKMLNNLPSDPPTSEIRPAVREMWEHYLEGQHAILNAVIAYAVEKREMAVELAKNEGVDLVFEEDEE